MTSGVNARLVSLSLLAALTAGTVYEAGVAFGAIPMGSQPGEESAGEGVVVLASLAAMLAGSVLAGVFAATRKSVRLAALFAPAASAFVVARFYTYDPYYLPTLRRLSDGGMFSATWVFSLVFLALLAGGVTLVRPRHGLVGVAMLMPVCAFTALFLATGH